jgi:hypothetical protein
MITFTKANKTEFETKQNELLDYQSRPNLPYTNLTNRLLFDHKTNTLYNLQRGEILQATLPHNTLMLAFDRREGKNSFFVSNDTAIPRPLLQMLGTRASLFYPVGHRYFLFDEKLFFARFYDSRGVRFIQIINFSKLTLVFMERLFKTKTKILDLSDIGMEEIINWNDDSLIPLLPQYNKKVIPELITNLITSQFHKFEDLEPPLQQAILNYEEEEKWD